MVVSQMNHRIERYSDTAVVTELAKTTATVAVATNNVIAAIGSAAATVLTNTGNYASWIAMGPAAYGAMVGMVDAAGRPLFPAIGPVNAIGTANAQGFGSSVMGLTPVVTPSITDKTMYVGNNFGLEVYERPLPLMQAFEPSVYGRQVAVATYLGFYAPITLEGGTPKREGIVKITWP